MRKQLVELAHARSGDKGDIADISLFAPDLEIYDLLAREVTADREKSILRVLSPATSSVSRFPTSSHSSLCCTARSMAAPRVL